MATVKMHEEEPLRKRLKLNLSNAEPETYQEQSNTYSARGLVPSMENADTSFTTAATVPLRSSSTSEMQDLIHDLTNYIPVGCLRINRSDCGISSDVWKSCHSWCGFADPCDIYDSRGGPYLLNALQETLLNTSVLQPYRGLQHAGWIRMEFKMRDQNSGQIRVYVLPDDVGRGSIDRQQSSLRRSMQLLLGQLDIARATWYGAWSDYTPVSHVDHLLNEQIKTDPSLFYIFNTLPSPKPDPECVADRYARYAMYRILESDIEGLTTKMHPYQRRSAAMMLQREMQPSQILDPRLRTVMDQRGKTWYCDLDAGSCLRDSRTYDAVRGGICAETMGLGKTLICLALILATRDLSSQIPVEYSLDTVPIRKTTGSLKDMSAATIGRTGTPWKSQFAQMEAAGYDFSRCLEAIRKGAGYYYLPSPIRRRESRKPIIVPPRKIYLTTATLVVVPSNLVQQWRHEIKKHTTGLQVLVVNSPKTRLPPAKELAKFDIILFSKQRFDKEAKDGSDLMGRRRTTTSNVCNCPYMGNTRERDCVCFKEEDAYRSPLKDLHFKRLITDEGHTFGNSSSSSKTEAVTVVEFLQLSARWIISGTPTQGLYGVEVALTDSGISTPVSPSQYQRDVNERPKVWLRRLSATLTGIADSESSSEASSEQERAFYKQERKDLEKLGNIATTYLKARPWANNHEDNDLASWSQYVMQPQHGSKSHGNLDCLRSTLEGIIIRHRPEDVMIDVTLPPLYQNIVYLDGSMQDKLSLNMFSMMIVSNAVTSERKDADYLFHPRQRKPLQELVSNLRQASFFWSGYTSHDIKVTVDIAKKFLENKDVPVSPQDEILLSEAIKAGEAVLSNNISKTVSLFHEMPMYVYNEYPDDVRAAWSLDGQSTNPTLMGTTMVHAAQKFVESHVWKQDPMEGLAKAGLESMNSARLAQNPPPTARPAKKNVREAKTSRKAAEVLPGLAGGVALGDGSSPKKRARSSSFELSQSVPSTTLKMPNLTYMASRAALAHGNNFNAMKPQSMAPETVNLKSALAKSRKPNIEGSLDPLSPLSSSAIISTSSAKLSYLMDRIITYHTTEKILVFYEADNVAYYIAQALECLHIKHLIYAKTLSSARRSQYVVTFNQSDMFRVLLMDVSQAAFGLDMSSASRVYFVNPVFSPQVEAQAVKRAHRIGQTKPVFVETLVLKGSIEEVILERRNDMSNEEHNRCKTILDDQTMYDWIRNVRFLPTMTDGMPGPEQFAKLENPQLVFGSGAGSTGGTIHDPDADLVVDELSPKGKGKGKGKSKSTGKAKASLSFDVGAVVTENRDEDSTGSGIAQYCGSPSIIPGLEEEIEYMRPKKKRKSVGFQLRNEGSSPSSSSTRSSTPTPTSASSTRGSPGNGEESLTGSPSKGQPAKSGENGPRSLLVNLRLSRPAMQISSSPHAAEDYDGSTKDVNHEVGRGLSLD